MPGRSQLDRLPGILAIVILAAVFGWSGINKINDPAGFSISVFRYHLLPYAVVNIAALWISGVELLCVILLFVPRFRIAALWVILALLMVFTLGIGINLARGSQMACGCFSSSPMAHPVGWFSVFKNIGLMILSMYAIKANSE